MPRPPRLDFEGAFHHVTARGNGRLPIYLDAFDRSFFLLLLSEITESYDWIVHSWCEMTNHYHLVLETPAARLAAGMRDLNGRYARAFNSRHLRQNHVFGGRYATKLVVSDPHLLGACRYVVLNPVRAGICRLPEDWPWSSYRATAGLAAAPAFLETGWLLSQFSGEVEEARRSYRDFVRQGMSENAAAVALGVRHVPDTPPRTPPGTRAPSAPR